MVFYSIVMLDKYARDFNAAHALIGFAEAMQSKIIAIENWEFDHAFKNNAAVYEEWKAIAARDGALSLYHFCTTFESIRAANAPTLTKAIDHEMIQEVAYVIRGKFAGYRAIRHTVSHTADFTRNYKAFVTHAVDGTTFIWGQLVGRRYTVTYEKSHFSYALDRANVETLLRLVGIVREAFHNTGFAKQSLS